MWRKVDKYTSIQVYGGREGTNKKMEEVMVQGYKYVDKERIEDRCYNVEDERITKKLGKNKVQTKCK